MKLLLLILLLPLAAAAQTVDPVISKDYLDRIRDGSHQQVIVVDTTNSAKNAFLILSKNYTGYKIKKITVKNGYLKIQPAAYKMLFLSGSFNSSVEIKKINQLPALQNQYVQGRSLNGSLAWQGPETNELFSYGPSVNSLEFDGSNYVYDINGKLVSRGSGNGKDAIAYDNDVFRTAALLSQSFTLQSRYAVHGNQYLARIKLGQSRENTFIKDNRNNSQNLSAFFETRIKEFKISVTYNKISNRFSNANRNGFLNRLYQESLLTPVSFDNAQGISIGNMQRSYSSDGDNPFFLLENNNNSFFQSHHSGSFVVEKNINRFSLRVAQSGEKLNENSNEGYKPGTAFFPNGILINRSRKDANYYLNVNASYKIELYNNNFRSSVATNYIYGNTNAEINYPAVPYQYRRSAHDFSLNYLLSYEGYETDAGIKLENKFYASNTSAKNAFFLPGISGYVRVDDIFDAQYLSLKLVANFNCFNSELPVSTSFSQNSLTRNAAGEALQYFPVTEVNSFNGLLPVRHKEWTARLELNFRNKLLFQAEYFTRKIKDDIFPLYENGLYRLKNIAGHRNRGVELELTHTVRTGNLSVNNSLSFFSYRDIVTEVKDGYNLTPISGFSDINKAIVQGQVLGAIVGNSFLKDNAGHIIIGDEGFPLVNVNPTVIGNPIPDFIMKLNNSIEWKRFSLNLDWEWRKGGDVWNGTQAVLDYYGRSANSALLRNTTNYIFNGISPDGHANNIPVSFYDPSLPLDKNRWVRYGYTGIAEEYVQKGDNIRINNIGISYRLRTKKYLQDVSFTLYAGNIVIWTRYKGADPNQLLYDQPDTNGLDFFNLPSVKNFGFTISIQF